MTTTQNSPSNRRKLRALGAGLALLSMVGIVSCGTADSSQTDATPTTSAAATASPLADTSSIDGVKVYSNLSSEHVTTKVTYDQVPGVGGDHSARWTSCGIYTTPVEEMQAVHSMEHGAVWLTYRPDLPADQIKALTNLVGKNTYILLSPFPDQASPITATAWGVQLALDTASDGRLPAFLRAYVQGEQTPEPGAPCTGGVMG